MKDFNEMKKCTDCIHDDECKWNPQLPNYSFFGEFCSRYTPKEQENTNTDHSDTPIKIEDTATSDATDFKKALSGAYLVSEVDDSKRKTNFEKIRSMSEEELSTKTLDSQIDNDPVLKRLEERIKESASLLTMINLEYSPEVFADRMKEIQHMNTYYGVDGKYVIPTSFHKEADELMLEFLKHLGYGEGCRIFENNEKWYN